MEEQVQPVSASTFRHSPSIAKISDALAKAQGEFLAVSKDAENPAFKRGNKVSTYADIASVITATRPALTKNGLAIIQSPRSGLVEGARCVIITTMLSHSSGEWMADELAWPIEKGFTAHAVGSAVTYGRRYAMQSFLGVAAEDDDGNAATGKNGKAEIPEETNEQFDQRTADQQGLKVFEITAIDEACKRTGKGSEEVEAYLGLMGHKRIEHVLRSDFKKFLAWANAPNGKTIAKALLKPAVDPRTAAMKKLFGVASEYSIPEEDVKRASYEKYRVDSMTKLTAPQLDEMTEWVKEVAAQV